MSTKNKRINELKTYFVFKSIKNRKRKIQINKYSAPMIKCTEIWQTCVFTIVLHDSD